MNGNLVNTRLIMFSSAIVLGCTGIALSFFNKEIASAVGVKEMIVQPISLQLIGALYFAFAMMNWTAKDNLIGGIYGRPIAIGNHTHFMIGALTLIKVTMNPHHLSGLWIITSVYSIFAVLFAIILYTHPVKKENPTI